jgi:hypothetical protein
MLVIGGSDSAQQDDALVVLPPHFSRRSSHHPSLTKRPCLGSAAELLHEPTYAFRTVAPLRVQSRHGDSPNEMSSTIADLMQTHAVETRTRAAREVGLAAVGITSETRSAARCAFGLEPQSPPRNPSQRAKSFHHRKTSCEQGLPTRKPR